MNLGKRFAGRGLILLIFVGFLTLTIMVQWVSGVYRSERGNSADEAAHFVTGLMVRDYLVSGFSTSPIQFAKNFYIHYPKVAFGYWPPLLHLALGVWMIPAPHSSSAALLLMAVITALLATQLYRALRPLFGVLQAAAIGLLFFSLPLILEMTTVVMADMTVALFAFLTALGTIRFFETGSARDGLFLGVYAGLGCMTKGNSMAAILCIALALACTRRFDLLRRPGLYMAAGVTIVLGLPGQAVSWYMFRRTNSPLGGPNWTFTSQALVFYWNVLFHTLGPILIVLIGVGILFKIPAIFQEKRPFWAVMFSLAVAIFLFHVVLPHPPDNRHLIAIFPPLLVFVPVALHRFAQALPFQGASKGAALFALFVLAMAARPFHFPSRKPLGYREAVEWLYQQPDFTADHPVLVVADGNGEGALVSEIAIRDQRPKHFILRGNKMLASSDWNGNYYHVVFDQAQDMLNTIEKLATRYMIVDRTDPSFGVIVMPHERQAIAMATMFSSRVQLVRSFPRVEGQRQRSLEVYRLPYSVEKRTEKILYHAQYTLGSDLVESGP